MGSPRSVSIGTTMAFAQLWLMPRLGDFWTAHQDIVVDHIISDRDAGTAAAPDVDLRVRYGDGDWPDETSALLFGDRIIAVAAPAFLARHKVKSVQDLSAPAAALGRGRRLDLDDLGGFPARERARRTASSTCGASTPM